MKLLIPLIMVLVLGSGCVKNPEQFKEYKDLVIELKEEGGRCENCPTYSVSLYGNGSVVYEGKENTNIEGIKTYQISKKDIANLVDDFTESGFFSLEDEYVTNTKDLLEEQTIETTISITLGGKPKKIHFNYLAPQVLFDLEYEIKITTNLDQLIYLNIDR